jgi:hypothetical protein
LKKIFGAKFKIKSPTLEDIFIALIEDYEKKTDLKLINLEE